MSTARDDTAGDLYAEGVGQIYAKATPPKLYAIIREDAWRRLCAERGLHGDAALGRELGVSPTTVWRIRTRQATPGIGFALQAMRIFGAPFEELFEVLEAEAGEDEQPAEQPAEGGAEPTASAEAAEAAEAAA